MAAAPKKAAPETVEVVAVATIHHAPDEAPAIPGERIALPPEDAARLIQLGHARKP